MVVPGSACKDGPSYASKQPQEMTGGQTYSPQAIIKDPNFKY